MEFINKNFILQNQHTQFDPAAPTLLHEHERRELEGRTKKINIPCARVPLLNLPLALPVQNHLSSCSEPSCSLDKSFFSPYRLNHR